MYMTKVPVTASAGRHQSLRLPREYRVRSRRGEAGADALPTRDATHTRPYCAVDCYLWTSWRHRAGQTLPASRVLPTLQWDQQDQS